MPSEQSRCGGFEIALACDIIFALENAIVALPEPRVGLIAGAGKVHRLPRVIPQKQALGMILTGRRVSAGEGKELGFVNELVPEGQAPTRGALPAGKVSPDRSRGEPRRR
jgi:enoyl-CoA hydratase/carnithine racemase